MCNDSEILASKENVSHNHCITKSENHRNAKLWIQGYSHEIFLAFAKIKRKTTGHGSYLDRVSCNNTKTNVGMDSSSYFSTFIFETHFGTLEFYF